MTLKDYGKQISRQMLWMDFNVTRLNTVKTKAISSTVIGVIVLDRPKRK